MLNIISIINEWLVTAPEKWEKILYILGFCQLLYNRDQVL